MPPPADINELLTTIRKSGLISSDKLDALVTSSKFPKNPEKAVETLVRDGLLTSFHARHILEGKYKGFVLGPYRVLRPLGKGGMGLIYQAEHASLGRMVALKILRTDMMYTRGALERFQREARATAAMDHPNIVRLYDIAQEGDVQFLVMEYVEGKSLEALLKQRGRFAPDLAASYAAQVAHGLKHAHERGIVHRDIKPSNLLVDQRGVVKILDMGLARFYEDHSDNLTERVGGILGSPDYIAPEQAMNRLDIRSDIYSLGATLYALLVGQPPFPGSTIAQKLIAHQTSPVIPPHQRDPKIPLELSSCVVRMLAKDPAHRFQTPEEVVEALTPWADSLPQILTPSGSTIPIPTQATNAAAAAATIPATTTTMTAPAPLASKNRILVVINILLLLCLAGIGVWALLRGRL